MEMHEDRKDKADPPVEKTLREDTLAITLPESKTKVNSSEKLNERLVVESGADDSQSKKYEEESKRFCLLCRREFFNGEANCPEDFTPLIVVKDPLIGSTLPGHYKIVRLIGRGSAGFVYQAINEKTGADAAVKVLARFLTDNHQAIRRFSHECQLSARLQSIHTSKIEDFGLTEDGRPYLVMDYIEGQSLNAVLRTSGGNKLDQPRALKIARQIAEGLAHAHALGIVHRDIKPSNIILSRDENGEELVKIIDFGIAYDMDGEVSAITAAGHVVGSPLFMSPEQCLGRALDARSDIYSLGSLCYRMLCGEPIYQETSLTNLMHLQVTTKPVSMRTYDKFMSEELDGIVLKALAKRPLDRFQTAAEFVGALDAFSETGKQDAGSKSDEQAA